MLSLLVQGEANVAGRPMSFWPWEVNVIFLREANVGEVIVVAVFDQTIVEIVRRV